MVLIEWYLFLCCSVNGRVRTDFVPTPIMSTYLVAFIISDFVNQTYDATVDFPTTHRIFSSDRVINRTSYALTEATTLLKALEDYLQVPYAQPKLDQAVLPKASLAGKPDFIVLKLRI